MKAELLKLIPKGKNNAVTSRILAAILQEDDRTIRKAITELINEGYCIASSTSTPKGYFMAETWQEVNDYVSTTRSRLIGDATRMKHFIRAAHKCLPPEQGVLF